MRNAGVEDLTVEYGDDSNINIYGAVNCWVKGVENTIYLNDGIRMNVVLRVQIEGSYLHQAAWPVNGGAGYALSMAGGAGEVLIENNISSIHNKVMVARSAGAGSVVGYNYMDDGLISGQESWVEIGLNGSHMVGPHHMLFEGNWAFNADSDDTHGNSIYQVYFRNHLTGYRSKMTNIVNNNKVIDDINNKPGGNGPLRAAGAMAYSYWFSYIGNVLGLPGKTNFDPYLLGWDSQAGRTDPGVAETALLNGNYNYKTGSVDWADGASHTLPNSMYLTSKPAFFGNNPWPWVDPINGTTATLPAKARFDAGHPNSP